MAGSDSRPNATSCMDSKSGFCERTKIFHSLRPSVPLPPKSEPLSLTQFALSLIRLSSPATNTTALIDSDSGQHLSYPLFLRRVQTLSFNLRALISLSKGDVAFILSPSSLQIPVLYFSLLSLGVVVCPANPLGSDSEVAHQVQLCKPVIAFATSSTANKIPNLKFGSILIDSPDFFSMMNKTKPVNGKNSLSDQVEVKQSDSAAILYSSGTTGRVKGVLLSHRNFIALIARLYGRNHLEDTAETPANPVSLFTLPLFHVFGFFMLILAISMGETLVLMQRFDFEALLRVVQKFRVSYMPVSPPLVVALVKSDLTAKYDLNSLLLLRSGGAPLGKEIFYRFREKFPTVEILQGYGLTESAGRATSLIGPEEYKHNISSVGKLAENMEAKIVDATTGEALPPGQKGELWLRGPTIMQGYIGDDEATSATLDPEGWLKTGDLCYFDSNGYLFIVDRLKELIKYKAYQVPPAELEHLLQSNLEIADAAVIPYPDEDAGEIPMAYVVRKPGSNITGSQVIDFIAKRVAPYKKIRRIAFLNSIPKSPAGKILRRELVQHALSSGLSKM